MHKDIQMFAKITLHTAVISLILFMKSFAIHDMEVATVIVDAKYQKQKSERKRHLSSPYCKLR